MDGKYVRAGYPFVVDIEKKAGRPHVLCGGHSAESKPFCLYADFGGYLLCAANTYFWLDQLHGQLEKIEEYSLRFAGYLANVNREVMDAHTPISSREVAPGIVTAIDECSKQISAEITERVDNVAKCGQDILDAMAVLLARLREHILVIKHLMKPCLKQVKKSHFYKISDKYAADNHGQLVGAANNITGERTRIERLRSKLGDHLGDLLPKLSPDALEEFAKSRGGVTSGNVEAFLKGLVTAAADDSVWKELLAP